MFGAEFVGGELTGTEFRDCGMQSSGFLHTDMEKVAMVHCERHGMLFYSHGQREQILEHRSMEEI